MRQTSELIKCIPKSTDKFIPLPKSKVSVRTGSVLPNNFALKLLIVLSAEESVSSLYEKGTMKERPDHSFIMDVSHFENSMSESLLSQMTQTKSKSRDKFESFDIIKVVNRIWNGRMN